ncbi:type VII secretion protein EccE [Micromonospora rosaria]|uniref:Type VII secretion protein EccE n=1 Tax=Micromonospora rosaria TaxID=47874 RepID=A0A136PW73_9ACTN|nr:type VII secretion protein EccE [Micromonospora rosaria]KXK62613.1 type VII secretion protein EccE [Micromonospora rosaria]
MTATTTGPPTQTVRQPLPAQWMPGGHRPDARIRAGQLVAVQVALAVPVAALGRGTGPVLAALAGAGLLVAGAWIRLRGRWLFEWLVVGLGYVTRRRALPATAGPAELLDLVSPGARLRSVELGGGPAAVVDDATGLSVLLDLGDPGDLLGGGRQRLPAPVSLLPPATADSPPVRIQLLLSGVAAPTATAGGATAATSYRQLTDGRLPAQGRAVLAVRVLRADGWSDEDLRRALAGVLRRIVRRLGPVPARPLGEHAALRVLAECAHLDDGQPTQETWQAVRTGPLVQATFRLRRWPDLRADGGRRLVSRMLALPAAATTVTLSAGPRAATARTQLTVRVAGWTTAELETAGAALRRLVTMLGGEVRRLDGEHLTGLAGTLPIAVSGFGPPTGGPGTGEPEQELELTLDDAGLMMGANRHGGALTVRVFRPEPTRIVLVGGVRAAQLMALRAMALGARVVVQTSRPRAWESFVRGVGSPGGTIPVLPPGRAPGGPPGSPLRPLLLVVDAGPVPADAGPGPAWQTSLVVRDELTVADVDPLGRADLAVLQPLDAGEAALAGTALGLGGSAGWLTRIREDMVAVVNRRALRWALLSPTPIESQVVGRPARR